MTTYIELFSLTDASIKAAKDSPRRLDAAKKLLADMGGEMKQFYMVMGEFDFVGICEAPHHAVMARYVPQLGASASWRRSFAEMAEDRSGDALLFERASNRPHDRARDFHWLAFLIAVSIERW